jgi:hypothetical protein
MNTRFQDLENDDNPRNGQVLSDRPGVMALLEELREIRPPFICQFVGDHGFNLTVGIGHEFGCVQHSANDGTPPYLMATEPTSDQSEMEFILGGTATPIDGRYRLSFSTVKEVVAAFVASGGRSDTVKWEEF